MEPGDVMKTASHTLRNERTYRTGTGTLQKRVRQTWQIYPLYKILLVLISSPTSFRIVSCHEGGKKIKHKVFETDK